MRPPAPYSEYKKGRGTNVPDDMFMTVSVQQQGEVNSTEVTRTVIEKKDREVGGSGS